MKLFNDIKKTDSGFSIHVENDWFMKFLFAIRSLCFLASYAMVIVGYAVLSTMPMVNNSPFAMVALTLTTGYWQIYILFKLLGGTISYTPTPKKKEGKEGANV